MAEKLSNFEFGLTHGAGFSAAGRIAQIAIDPEMSRFNAASLPEGYSSYPPVLTAEDYAAQHFVRSDITMTKDEERELKESIQVKLLLWSEEGFFDTVPLPRNARGNMIGFKIRDVGMLAASEALQSQATRLSAVAKDAKKRLPPMAV